MDNYPNKLPTLVFIQNCKNQVLSFTLLEFDIGSKLYIPYSTAPFNMA